MGSNNDSTIATKSDLTLEKNGDGPESFMDLPSEMLMEIIANLGVANGELYRVALVCRNLHLVTRSDSLCEVMAKQLFPSQTLKLASSFSATTAETKGEATASDDALSPAAAEGDSPYTSWRALLMDGNAANGLFVKRIRGAVSLWRGNSSHRFFVNSIRRMAWDASQKQVHLVLDAYGNSDLREAHTTSVYRNKDRLTVLSHQYLRISMGHHVCILTFDDSEFCYQPVENKGGNKRYAEAPETTFRYVYNGGGLQGTDYPTATFLRMTPASTLKRIFQLGFLRGTFHNEDGTNGGAKSDEVSFQSRPLSYNLRTDNGIRGSDEVAAAVTSMADADDLLDWEGFTLPRLILDDRQRGQWGDGFPANTEGPLLPVNRVPIHRNTLLADRRTQSHSDSASASGSSGWWSEDE